MCRRLPTAQWPRATFAFDRLHHVQLAIPHFAAARKAHPGILVTNLRELAETLSAARVEVTWDGEFPGHERFYAADPFGNRLEFLEQLD